MICIVLAADNPDRRAGGPRRVIVEGLINPDRVNNVENQYLARPWYINFLGLLILLSGFLSYKFSFDLGVRTTVGRT